MKAPYIYIYIYMCVCVCVPASQNVQAPVVAALPPMQINVSLISYFIDFFIF